MGINRKVTYKNQRIKNFELNDKVIKSVKVNPKSEAHAKQKAKEEREKTVDDGTVDSIEFINAYNNNADFIDIIVESSMKPVSASMQWLEASSDIVKYNWLPEEQKYLDLNNNTCVENNLVGIYS